MYTNLSVLRDRVGGSLVGLGTLSLGGKSLETNSDVDGCIMATQIGNACQRVMIVCLVSKESIEGAGKASRIDGNTKPIVSEIGILMRSEFEILVLLNVGKEAVGEVQS